MTESTEHRAVLPDALDSTKRAPKRTIVAGLSELDIARHRLDVVSRILGGWVWETDAEHRFVYMSPSVTEFTGKSPEWHYGKTRQQLGNMNLATADGQSWATQLERHEPFGPVDFIRYQSSGPLVMRSLGTPQFAADGTFTGYCGVAFAVPTEPADEQSERRGEARRKVVRAGEIILPAGAAPIGCVLLDISTSGARLRLPGEVEITKAFNLKVVSLGLHREAAVRWRRGDEIGVEFAD